MAYTWLQFRNQVKSLMSDAQLNDITAILAISEFVKSYVAREINKDTPTSQLLTQNWLVQRDRLLGYTPTISGATLRTAVNGLLTVDSNRKGISETDGYIDKLIVTAVNELTGAGAFIDNYIRQGVLDLQHFVDYYRMGQERVFTFGDAVADGQASDFSLPDQAMIRDMYYVQDSADCIRKPVAQYDWQNRYDLVCGEPRLFKGDFFAAVDPNGKKLICFPALADGFHLSVFYDGLKIDFADGDIVPFDEGAAQAVADFVRARQSIQPQVANQRLMAIHEQAYQGKRRQLYRDAKEKQRVRYLNDSPFPRAGLPCRCSSCSPTITGGGGGGTSDGGCAPIIDVENVEAMKELPSAPCRHIVFIRNPEPGMSLAYRYKHSDTTEDNGFSIVNPFDGLGRYFTYNLQ